MNIPEFETLEEMATFWDTHDLTEFEDQLVEVREPIFAHLNSRFMTVILDEKHYEMLKKIAEQEHRHTIALLNEWIITLLDEKYHSKQKTLNISSV